MAFTHLREAKTFTEASVCAHLKLRSLMKSIKRFKMEGFEGVKDKTGRGVKPLIPLEHQVAFRQAVLELQENRTGARIRSKDILEFMQTKYGINPTLRTVYKSLKRAPLVWIRGRSIHPKSDLEAQEALKKNPRPISRGAMSRSRHRIC